jgi:hypothetical protein
MALNPSQCKHVRECGAPVVREIPTLSSPNLPITRNGMMQMVWSCRSRAGPATSSSSS